MRQGNDEKELRPRHECSDPRPASASLKFEHNDVILPIYVIEEIDHFKRDANERGRNARTVSRLLDAQRAKGPLSKGVELTRRRHPAQCMC